MQDWSSVELPQQDVPPLLAAVATILDLCWVLRQQSPHAPHDAQEQSTDCR